MMETSDVSGEQAPAPGAPETGDSEATEPGLDPIAQADAEIAKLKADLKEKEAKYLYLYADFENFKKRAFKERDDARKFGWEGVAQELLGVYDNLERAVGHMPANVDKNLAQGIQLVLGQFLQTMLKNGIQEIEALKKPFDPNFHDAVGQEPASEAAGNIVQVQQKGFLLHGRLLRPARVVVSAGSGK